MFSGIHFKQFKFNHFWTILPFHKIDFWLQLKDTGQIKDVHYEMDFRRLQETDLKVNYTYIVDVYKSDKKGICIKSIDVYHSRIACNITATDCAWHYPSRPYILMTSNQMSLCELYAILTWNVSF